MSRFKWLLAAPVLMVLLYSCAASYKPILPFQLTFPEADTSGFAYKYNVLRHSGNRILTRKEGIYKIHVVAVSIQNNTGKAIRYGRDFTLMSGNGEVTLMKSAAIAAKIKQTPGVYLFYLLLAPLRIKTHPNGYSTKTYHVGLALGTSLAGGNMAMAVTSNRRFLQELEMESLDHKVIKPGETFTGLIGIKSKQQLLLSLKFKE